MCSAAALGWAGAATARPVPGRLVQLRARPPGRALAFDAVVERGYQQRRAPISSFIAQSHSPANDRTPWIVAIKSTCRPSSSLTMR